MKKFLFILITVCCFLLTFHCYSQGYKSIFGKQSTSWKLTFCNLDIFGYDSLIVNGDTLVKNKTYKKVYNHNMNSLYGGVREDTALGQAWWITLKKNYVQDSVEVLIMNMKLSVGDSFNFNMLPGSPDNNKWIKVTHVYFKSGSKYIVFNQMHGLSYNGLYYKDTITFIEGLGPNYSVMYLTYGSLDLCPYVICSYKDNLLYYSTSNKYFDNCLLNPQPGIVEYSKNESFNIFPNPSSNILNIELNNSTNQQFNNSTTLKIYNLQGQEEFEKQLTNPKSQIDVSNLPQGLYFLKIQSTASIFITKFIKN